MRQWVVDAFNVVGAQPDGWWRDRAGALIRLVDEITRWRGETGDAVLVMIDGRPDPLGPPPGVRNGVDVRYAGRSDRNAADDAIVELLAPGGELAASAAVVVATSDRHLRRRVGQLDAQVEGGRAFRQRLADVAPR